MQIDYIISNAFTTLHGCEFLNKILLFITEIGNNGYLFIALAIFLLPFKKFRRLSYGIAISAILVLIVNNIALKHLILRPRPFVTYPEFLPHVIGTPPTSLSFPSGHTAVSFAFATFFWFFKKKHLKLAIFTTVYAVLVAFSRIYTIQHYFTDVLGGIAVGIACGTGGYFLAPLVEKLLVKLNLFEPNDCEK